MNLSELHRKLIAGARAHPPADAMPYAFEKRIMARLASLPALDPWAAWARGLTRAAAFCVAATLLLAAGSFFHRPPAASSESLSQAVESTLFAAVDNNTTIPADIAAQPE